MTFLNFPPEISFALAAALCLACIGTTAMTQVLGIGGGITMLAVLAFVLPPYAIVPVYVLVQLGTNCSRAFVLRPFIHWRVFLSYGVGAAIGILVAKMLYVQLPVWLLRIVLGVFVIAVVWRPKRVQEQEPKLPTYGIVGVLAGGLSLFIGATGPFIASVFPVRIWQRQAVVATHATCITLQHFLAISGFLTLGFNYIPWIGLAAAMIACGFIGAVLGKQALGKINEASFKFAFKIVLTALGIWQIIQGLVSYATLAV